jgi:hypothetical protein
LSLCDMVGCDLTFGLSQSKSRAPVRDRFRQFPAATRFDTVWAMKRHSLLPATGPLDDRFTLDNGLTRVDRSESTYRAHAPPDDLQQLTINGSQVVRRSHSSPGKSFASRPLVYDRMHSGIERCTTLFETIEQVPQ